MKETFKKTVLEKNDKLDFAVLFSNDFNPRNLKDSLRHHHCVLFIQFEPTNNPTQTLEACMIPSVDMLIERSKWQLASSNKMELCPHIIWDFYL